MQIHSHLLVSGHHRNALAATKLVETYAKVGRIDTARLVFDTSPGPPDHFMYGVLIKCYTWSRLFFQAISLYHDMRSRQVDLNRFVFPPVLGACSGLSDVQMGRRVHGDVIKTGFEFDSVIETALLHMYGGGGYLESAYRVFDGMSERDVISWGSMISSCVRGGRVEEGLKLFSCMHSENVEPDMVTMLSLTQACADLGLLRQAKSVHGNIVRREVEIGGSLENSLITMYSKCEGFDIAEKIFFRGASQRDVVSWTAMISCYNQQSRFREALNLYVEMRKAEVKPNQVTMAAVMHSSAQSGCLREGKSVHGFLIRADMDSGSNLIATGLIDLYSRCGDLEYCLQVFENESEKTLVSWNSLIAAYARNGASAEAVTLFVEMWNEGLLTDSFSLASSLSACGHINSSHLGSQIHGHVVKTGYVGNEFVQNALIDMYCKCGFPDTARDIFDVIRDKRVVAWNTMMGGLAENGNSVEAIALFDRMYMGGLKMDELTFLSVIQACSHLGYLEKARWIHHKLIINGLQGDTFVETSVADMYVKCGDIQTAETVFDNMMERNVASYAVMIAGYGLHGRVSDAISIFSQMMSSGVRPNKVVFMSILNACSHAGCLKEGQYYFDLMRWDFGIEPELDHYTCLVDLLSRAGLLGKAYGVIKSMPMEADVSTYAAFLNGCRIHRRSTDVIDVIEREILNLEPSSSGYHVLLSNIFAEEGNWNEFLKIAIGAA
ncbi:putative pentatricopeptide repeat-containing protein [Acorus calamus]|uniref:Pentatricopeptide repeat-containing protein n=1 Tax=Acorus calamus TaxID=4465 RepID=A0AAV9D9D7_ACOCL|nr:putative pentatricopeptide repeat-containing protein [Acorus calamus]